MIKEDFKNFNFSLLGKQSQFEGEFKFKGDTILNCELKGLVNVSEGKLIIERTAQINGQLFCDDVEIFGNFTGSINASGTLTVRSSANVSGKIAAKKLSIYPGAIINFEGHTEENL